MSTTVDQRVVEMRFDNKNFESNVSTTMSTLDKLKQKLNLTGASKGLEEINSTAKKIDMAGLGRSVETVSAKFSALQVMGVTALANITNSAVNAGKRMLAAFTVDPVKTGFQEYELKMGSVQTIMASTGESLKTVNKYLDELNTYSDKTIYSFSDMTNNIGKFTNAGVKLEDAVLAIKGISNEAAVSGANANEASRAMYNFSQALSAGYVKLIDWKSIENANMATVEFKDQLIASAVACGTLKDNLDGTYTTLEKGTVISATRNFNDSLQEQWMTTEVLTKTLANYATDVREMTDAEKEAYEEKLRGQGYTEEQIKSIEKLGQKAFDSAQDVKTFSMMMDTLKEAAQSGWARTWELIIGDFEEAKLLWTNLSKVLGNIIDGMSDARNAILESALGKSFTNLIDKVNSVTDPIKKSADSIKEVVDSVKNYAEVVDDIIGGNWGNGRERWDKLTEAGYDWAHAQNLVNEKLGNAKKHATEYAEAQDKVKESQDEVTESTKTLTDEEKKRIIEMASMMDSGEKSKKLTKEQIEALTELCATADKLGLSVEDFVNNIDEIDGRWLLINSFKNAGKGLLTVIQSIGEAWRKAFHGNASDEEILNKRSEAIFNMIAALHKFSTYLIVDDDAAEKLVRTFKGLFAILDLITTVAGGGLKIAFKVLSSILSYFNLDILDVTALVGDAIVKFRDWFDSIFDISGALDVIIPAITSTFKAIKKWINGVQKLDGVEHLIESISRLFRGLSSIKIGNLGVFDKITSAFKNLTGIDLTNVGKNIFDGLIKGLAGGASKVIDVITEAAVNLIDKFCDILGIHSPSKVFIAIGGFIIAGLLLGIKEGFVSVPESLQGIVDKCLEVLKNIDWGTVFAIGVSITALAFIKKVGDALEAFSAPFAGLGDILSETAGVVKSFGKVTKAIAMDIKTKALKNLAVSLAILVGCVVAIVYVAGDDYTKIVKAAGIITWLAGVLVALAVASSLMSNASVKIGKEGASIDGLKNGLISMAVAIGLLALTVKLIGSMSLPEAIGGFVGLAVLMGAILGFMYVCQKITANGVAEDVTKLAALMTRLSIAMLLMVGVCKLAGTLSKGEMIKGAGFAVAFMIFTGVLGSIADSIDGDKNIHKLGSMMIKMAIAIGLMVGICKLVSMLEPTEIIAGASFALAFVGFVKLLVKATQIGNDKQIVKLGGLLLSISFSMMLMVGVCKLIGMLSPTEMLKGAAFVLGFTVFVGLLVAVTKVSSEQQIAKVSAMILALSVAIGVLAGVSIIMSLMSIEGLAKGVTAVSILGLIMAAMIYASRGANDIKGNLIVMTVAIALMAAAVAGLSFIDPKKLAGATIAMTMLIGIFAVLVNVSKYKSNVNKSILTLAALVVAVGMLAGVLWLMSTLNVQSVMKNAAALSVLLLAVSGSMLILNKMELTGSLKKIGLLMAMSAPLILFAIALKQMNGIENAVTNALVLGGLMLAMTGVLALLSVIGKGTIEALGGVIGLTALIAPMLAFIYALKQMNGVENAKNNAIVLGGLMAAMTLVLGVLTIIGFGVISALAGVIALTTLALPMLTFVYVLNQMNNVQNASANAELLISLMTTMTEVLTQLAIVGPLALIGVTAMQGLMILVGELGIMATAVGYLMEKFPSLQKFIDIGLPVLEQLANGIGIMIGKFVGGIGEGLGDSLVKIGEDLVEFMGSLQEASAKAEGIKGESFDGVKELIGALVGVGLTSVGMSIADVWTNVLGDKSAIEKFKEDGIAFFEAFKEIAETAKDFALPEGFSVEAVKTLITAIASIGLISVGTTLADIFTSKIGDKTTMEKFKEDGKAFFTAIKEIAPEMEGASLPEDFSIEGLTKLLDALKKVGNSMIGLSIADIFSKIVGDEGSMEKFKTDGVNFFTAIKAISKQMTGFSLPEDFTPDSLTRLFEILKSVSNYTIGASWGDIFTLGGTTIEKFQSDGVTFFIALKTISTEASGINIGSFTAAENAISKIKSVIASVNGIDYSGVKEFTGIGTGGFGADGPMHDIAVALKDYGDTVAGINIEAMTVSIASANKLRDLVSSLVTLDTSGIENFKVKAIGSEMKAYANEVGGIDPTIVASSISSANRLITLIRSLVGIDTSGISSFKVESIGDKMNAYSVSVSDMNVGAINASISAANRLRSLVNSLAGLNTSGVGSFKTAIESLGSIQVNNIAVVFNRASVQLVNIGAKMINSVTNGMKSRQSHLMGITVSMINVLVNNMRKSSTAFNTTGIMLMTKFASGISSRKGTVVNAVKQPIMSALSEILGYYSSFHSAGSYLVDGFSSGISANTFKAKAAAIAMAEAALNAARAALREHSPSRVFYEVGDYAGQGFVNALGDYETISYNSSYDMADYARRGLSDAISKIQDVVNSDMDAQPTIRPVLDLSDVRSGAAAIGSLFSGGTSVGVMANVGSISSMMNQRIQNGGNYDVVSAIDGLRKDIGNLNNTTYSINGITYDDGSNISNAVESLVRAAKIERRI